MLGNYLKVAFRNIRRHKGYSFINILGLAIGMACCILIMLWVQDELSYDRFHEKADNIYRVCISYKVAGLDRNHWRTPPPLAEDLKATYSEIRASARYTVNRGELVVAYGELRSRELIGFGDPELFDIFTLPFVMGDKEAAFTDPYSVVIGERMAKKYFGAENPIGKTLRVENQFELTVTGIIKDIPLQSHLAASAFTQFTTMTEFFGRENLQNWGDFGFNTFVLLNESARPTDVNFKIADHLIKSGQETQVELYLQPLDEIHLHDVNGGGAISYVYAFSFIAILIILVACVNFTNLTTARMTLRAREISLRKTIGGHRQSIMLQFLTESVIYAFVALLLSLTLIEICLPYFEDFTGRTLELNLGDSGIILFLSVFTLLTGLISGLYPATILSSLQPVETLKGSTRTSSATIRRVLVVGQFAVSAVLIVAAITVSEQLDHMRSRDLGFKGENIVYIPLNGSLVEHRDVFKQELLSNPGIAGVATSSSVMGLGPKWSTTISRWEGIDKETQVNLGLISVDCDFADVFKVEMISGRFFSKEFTTDAEGVILNQAAIKAMGISEPVGKTIAEDWPIIGVVRDFNFRTLHNEVAPLALVLVPEWDSQVAIKVAGPISSDIIDHIRDTFESVAPAFPFEIHFQDDKLESAYMGENRLQRLIEAFALLAVFISSLGVLGLVSFTVRQRVKEIGIRKVLGSSVIGIVRLLTREFVLLILIANLIAWPVARLVMGRWLESFAYRIEISAGPAFLAGLVLLGIAEAITGFQAIRAARANPVESLRYE